MQQRALSQISYVAFVFSQSRSSMHDWWCCVMKPESRYAFKILTSFLCKLAMIIYIWIYICKLNDFKGIWNLCTETSEPERVPPVHTWSDSLVPMVLWHVNSCWGVVQDREVTSHSVCLSVSAVSHIRRLYVSLLWVWYLQGSYTCGKDGECLQR